MPGAARRHRGVLHIPVPRYMCTTVRFRRIDNPPRMRSMVTAHGNTLHQETR